MGRAGRLQGEPKGETAQANALAVFLRSVTEGRTVRELAKAYGAGRTSWSDYRSGAKIIPLELLKRVISGRVRDERGRAALWDRARRLHAAACAAEQGRAPADGGREDAPRSWEVFQRAQRRADAELARSEEALRTLLGLTTRLRKELDDALARGEGGGGGPAAGPEPRPQAPPRQAPGTDGTPAHGGARVPGTELVLWAPRPGAPYGPEEAAARIGAETEVRRQQLGRLREEVRELREVRAAPAGSGL
ncbi:hypothetical protein ACFXA3_42290, partial [Streptomyces sp. NPDC059456]